MWQDGLRTSPRCERTRMRLRKLAQQLGQTPLASMYRGISEAIPGATVAVLTVRRSYEGPPISLFFFSGGGNHNDIRGSEDDRKIQNQSFAPANRGPKGQPKHTTKRHPAPHFGDKLRTWGPDKSSRAREDAPHFPARTTTKYTTEIHTPPPINVYSV